MGCGAGDLLMGRRPSTPSHTFEGGCECIQSAKRVRLKR